MKVLLVDTPFSSDDIGGERELFAGVENVIPALGLAYLAAVAEQEGHAVRVFEGVLGHGLGRLEELARQFQPQLVGIAATTPTFGNACRAAELLRSLLPDLTVVVGGSHPTAMPQLTAASGVFDYLVLGEGEQPFARLLRFLSDGTGTLDAIPGLVVVREGVIVSSSAPSVVEDLDSIPLPARHLLAPLAAYHPTPASLRRLPLAHIMSSRGCPSRCRFCDRAVFGDRVRERSVDNVMAEVEQVLGLGAREIRFFDDTFTLNRARLLTLCQELRRLKPPLPWTCLTRVNCVDIELLEAMASAGCWQVLFGLESGDDRVLASLGKGTTVAQNRRAVELARQAGLRVRADFLVGSPHETPESLQATLDIACELEIDFAHFNKFVPFPGTLFHDELLAQGHRFDFEASSTLDHDALVYVPPALDAAEYQRFLDRSYRRFYFRPQYLLRRLMGLRTLTELQANLLGSRTLGRW